MSTAKYICIVKDHFYLKPVHEVCPFFHVHSIRRVDSFFLVHSCITFAVCWVRRLCMFDVHFVSALPLLSACIISSHFSKVFFVSHYRFALAFSSQFQMKHRSLSFHETSCVTQVEVFNFGYLTRFFRFCLSTALAVFNLSDKINNIYSFNQSGLVTLSKYHNFIVHSISFG